MEDFIKTINVYDYEHFRDKIMKECNISRSTWSAWRNGGSISKKYKSIIDRIAVDMFGRTVFDK